MKISDDSILELLKVLSGKILNIYKQIIFSSFMSRRSNLSAVQICMYIKCSNLMPFLEATIHINWHDVTSIHLTELNGVWGTVPFLVHHK